MNSGGLFSCSLWPDVTEEQWENWHWQLENRISTLEKLKEIIQLTEDEEKGIRGSRGRLSMAITPYFASLMDSQRPNCPLRRQAIPSAREFYI
ncbi:MAG: hypothetical protein JW869_01710, partial [Candidatus Omnitrophica bacterium]|nr:hypothetical protein [Candidatus Omnitrophota bacterium]